MRLPSTLAAGGKDGRLQATQATASKLSKTVQELEEENRRLKKTPAAVCSSVGRSACSIVMRARSRIPAVRGAVLDFGLARLSRVHQAQALDRSLPESAEAERD